jgi:hypothetical protein
MTLAQYFESIHNAWVNDGLLQRKRKDQIRQTARCDYRHEIQSRYHDKLKHISENKRAAAGKAIMTTSSLAIKIIEIIPTNA